MIALKANVESFYLTDDDKAEVTVHIVGKVHHGEKVIAIDAKKSLTVPTVATHQQGKRGIFHDPRQTSKV